MAHLYVLQHHPAEDPGTILDWARASGHALDILFPAQRPLPSDIDGIDGLILLGGPWCAFADDRPSWLQHEQTWLRRRLDEGMPVFAVCLGAQLVAQALGANLQRMPTTETGWVAIDPFEPDTGDEGPAQARRLEVLQWHEDRFDLPPGCVRIAANADAAAEPLCPVQAYAGSDGRIVGLQFHAEWTPETVVALHWAFGEDCPLPKASAQARYQPQHDDPRYGLMHAWLHGRLDRWLRESGAA